MDQNLSWLIVKSKTIPILEIKGLVFMPETPSNSEPFFTHPVFSANPHRRKLGLKIYKFPCSMDDNAKGCLTQFWELLTVNSLSAKRFQTLTTSLFDDIWISNVRFS